MAGDRIEARVLPDALGREPELDRIELRAQEITDALQADEDAFLSLPMSWLDCAICPSRGGFPP